MRSVGQLHERDYRRMEHPHPLVLACQATLPEQLSPGGRC